MIVLFIVLLVAILFICVLLLTSMRNEDGNKKRGVRMISSKKKSKYALEIEFENEEVKNTLLIAMRDAYGNVETREDTSLRIVMEFSAYAQPSDDTIKDHFTKYLNAYSTPGKFETKFISVKVKNIVSLKSSNMISLSPKGGLGNQLFQIWTLIHTANKADLPFYIEFSKKTRTLSKKHPRVFYWDTFLEKLKPYVKKTKDKRYVSHKEQGYDYNPLILSTDKSTRLDGYFQSYKYFEEGKNKIYDFLEIGEKKERLLNKYPKDFFKNTVSLHFRLGDYKLKKSPSYFLPLTYYINALTKLVEDTKREWRILYFYELSDSSDVQKNVTNLMKLFPTVVFEGIDLNLADWEQMLVMSLCQHNIIANSTFSWWGAYLNANRPNVYYPSQWFTKNIETDDLCPDHWISTSIQSYDVVSLITISTDIKLEDIFKLLQDYVVVKFNEKLPNFNKNDDIDILTSNVDENINIILDWYDKDKFRHNIVKVNSFQKQVDLIRIGEKRLTIKFDLYEKMLYKKFSLHDSVYPLILKNKIHNGLTYIPCLADDLSIRYCEYIEYPFKKKHLEYTNKFLTTKFHRVKVGEIDSKLNYGATYTSIIVWGHGICYTQQILHSLMEDIDCDILNIKKNKINDLEKFIKICYKSDLEKPQQVPHIRAKTAYLKNVPLVYVHILVKNYGPSFIKYGKGDDLTIADKNLTDWKWKIREMFNPKGKVNKKPLSSGITHNHVIHVTDTPEDCVDLCYKLLKKKPVDFENKVINGYEIPWHLPGGSMSRKMLDISEIRVNIVGKGIKKIESSPHYEYVLGNKEPYTKYISKYCGEQLQDNHTTKKFDILIKNFDFSGYNMQDRRFIIVKKKKGKYVVMDGVHRLAILKMNYIDKINVLAYDD